MKRFLIISVTFSLLCFGFNDVSIAGNGTECTSTCVNDCPVNKGVAQKCVRNKKTNKCSCQNPTTASVDDIDVGAIDGPGDGNGFDNVKFDEDGGVDAGELRTDIWRGDGAAPPRR